MSNVIDFPFDKNDAWARIEKSIDGALSNVKPEYKDSLKQEALNTLKEYEGFCPHIQLELPSNISETQISKLKEAFNDSNKQKLKMIAVIVNLRISRLIDKIEHEDI